MPDYGWILSTIEDNKPRWDKELRHETTVDEIRNVDNVANTHNSLETLKEISDNPLW